MTILVVTGTSTDVGKTIATAAFACASMARGASVAVAKPAQTGVHPGEPGDLAEIVRLVGDVETVESARYPDPLAPDVAARLASAPMLDLATVITDISSLEEDVVIVEGAGGLLVRLGVDGFTLLDVARELDAPVVVVCGAELGTLNHAALTVNALRHADVTCSGLVIGSWPDSPSLAARTNLVELPVVTGVPVIGSIPAGASALGPDIFAEAAPGWFDGNVITELLGV